MTQSLILPHQQQKQNFRAQRPLLALKLPAEFNAGHQLGPQITMNELQNLKQMGAVLVLGQCLLYSPLRQACALASKPLLSRRMPPA